MLTDDGETTAVDALRREVERLTMTGSESLVVVVNPVTLADLEAAHGAATEWDIGAPVVEDATMRQDAALVVRREDYDAGA